LDLFFQNLTKVFYLKVVFRSKMSIPPLTDVSSKKTEHSKYKSS